MSYYFWLGRESDEISFAAFRANPFDPRGDDAWAEIAAEKISPRMIRRHIADGWNKR